jgi:enoyl-[acyl-carrier protein] reductase/trans-2-enoyl-CoA reductase (NAD+)
MSADQTAALETFPKLPLGGVDRRALVEFMSTRGAATARADLARDRAALRPQGARAGESACVLLLGGSNGILRSVAVQLVFAERVPVWAVHYDSEKLQIGVHHARAITEAAREHGVDASFRNADATKPDVVREVVAGLRERYRLVHVINGIASGATKRYAEHGPTKVRDLDVGFDPVRQIPDFSTWESVRRVGLVDVDVATPQDVERTNKMMGTSTAPWADALAEAGLLVRGQSVVAFADYDFEPDDPVYAMGPLAGAKVLQRESMDALAARYGVRTVRLCYPAMNTTAIGAIPGGALMFAGTAELLIAQGRYKNLARLAEESMALFAPGASEREVRLDQEYQAVRPAFHALADRLDNGNLRASLPHVVGHAGL